jgi:hypothetical protein
MTFPRLRDALSHPGHVPTVNAAIEEMMTFQLQVARRHARLARLVFIEALLSCALVALLLVLLLTR